MERLFYYSHPLFIFITAVFKLPRSQRPTLFGRPVEIGSSLAAPKLEDKCGGVYIMEFDDHSLVGFKDTLLIASA
jgi:hypothetical protein